MLLSLMLIAICGHSRRFVGGSAHEISQALQIPLLFTMSRLDSAGEFRARATKNNGGPHMSRQRARFGPGAEIDERARAAAAAEGDFGGTNANFVNENSTRPLSASLPIQ
jgi:hypothetical protein